MCGHCRVKMRKDGESDHQVKCFTILKKKRFFVNHRRCARGRRHKVVIRGVTRPNAIKGGVREGGSDMIAAKLDLSRHNVRPNDATAFVEERCQPDACA